MRLINLNFVAQEHFRLLITMIFQPEAQPDATFKQTIGDYMGSSETALSPRSVCSLVF